TPKREGYKPNAYSAQSSRRQMVLSSAEQPAALLSAASYRVAILTFSLPLCPIAHILCPNAVVRQTFLSDQQAVIFHLFQPHRIFLSDDRTLFWSGTWPWHAPVRSGEKRSEKFLCPSKRASAMAVGSSGDTPPA